MSYLLIEGSTVHAWHWYLVKATSLFICIVDSINPNQSVFGGGQIVLCNQLEALYVCGCPSGVLINRFLIKLSSSFKAFGLCFFTLSPHCHNYVIPVMTSILEFVIHVISESPFLYLNPAQMLAWMALYELFHTAYQ